MNLLFAYSAIIYIFEKLPVLKAALASVFIMGIVFIVVKFTENTFKGQLLVLNAVILIALSMFLLLMFNYGKIDWIWLIDFLGSVKVFFSQSPS